MGRTAAPARRSPPNAPETAPTPARRSARLRAAGPDRALLYPRAPVLDDDPPAGRDSFLESLMDTELYSMGAFFSDRHPELVDDVIARSEAIEDTGLERYARTESMTLEEGFQTLITGLAVRYYKAING